MASIWLNRIYTALGHEDPVIETWNPDDALDPEATLIDTTVMRPVATADSLAALQELKALQASGSRRVWFCGSYAGDGIPLLESAVSSAKQVSEALAVTQGSPQ